MWAPTPDEWQQLEPLVDALLDADAGARQALLERSFSSTPELRAWAERLVAGASDPSWMNAVSPALVSGAFGTGGVLPPGANPVQAGTRIGPFLLVREIGRGGMGLVFLAERDAGTFKQRVALKVVASAPVSAELQRRVLAEQHALARLEHPNVARIVDGGVQDGRSWFAMEYVDGERIDTWCDTRRLDLRVRA
jgi:eukaryotic-like serine/threonine-protein kinase